jgi:hypothetical protein
MALSDEEFLRSTPPGVEEATETTVAVSPEIAAVGETTPADDGNAEVVAKEQPTSEVVPETASEAVTEAVVDPAADPKEGESASEVADYEALYKQIMAPFKADGKTIELRNVDEAVKLMQMGANYTRKMQSLSGQRKIITMLENNELLDEGKLSFLIDLEKKNPAAIQKLLRESGVDPLSIDTTGEDTYRAGNHAVTDNEVRFRSVLDELSSSDTGKTTLQEINSSWDDASKEIIWENPEVVTAIHEQRESGLYAKITAEMERQTMLGAIPPNTPFLHAYHQVGDAMMAALKPPANQPLETRVVPAQKSPAGNDAKLRAASSTRSTAPAAIATDPAKLSDAEFMQFMQKRT